MTIPMAHGTHRHRGLGRRPSGNSRSGYVRSVVKIGTQAQFSSQVRNTAPVAPGWSIAAHCAYVAANANTAPTPAHTPRKIHPIGLRGSRRAMTRPTTPYAMKAMPSEVVDSGVGRWRASANASDRAKTTDVPANRPQAKARRGRPGPIVSGIGVATWGCIQGRWSQRGGPPPRRGSPPLPACWHHPPTVVSAGSFVQVAGPTVATETQEANEVATIVVGTDTSAAADLAVDEAGRLARANGDELVVLLVRPDGDLRAVVDPAKAADPERHLSDLVRRFPDVTVRARIEHGDAAERICEVAGELKAETIVVGNRGTRGSWWKVKDSVPNLVLRHAPCSVYIVDTRRAQWAHGGTMGYATRARSPAGTRARPSHGGARRVPR